MLFCSFYFILGVFSHCVHDANVFFLRYIQPYCLKSHFTSSHMTERPACGSALSEAIKTDHLKLYI